MSWQLGSLLLLAIALAGGFAWYELERPAARVLGLVAALAALAVVGRLAFAAIPNVKPTTDIVLFAGLALGAAPGFAVGAVTALVSNVFLSQGPWTVWQMAGWGAVGVGGALLGRLLRGREPSRFLLAASCGLAGALFGAWMDVYQWTLAARQDADTYLAIAASSFPYNVAHVVGNIGFALLLGPLFVRALGRYKRRFEVRWPAAAGASAALALALAAGSSIAAQAPARAEAAAPAQAVPAATATSPSARAARYLLGVQNADGGFGGARGQASSPLYTGWAALGLAAAGRNPRDVRARRGRSIVSNLARAGGGPRDVGAVERTILTLRAAGLSGRRFAGRDLVAEVERRRRGDGSIGGYVSYTAFGVLALRSARVSAGARTLAWLTASQNADGGFGVARSSPADTDMTGAVLQALAVSGRSQGVVASRAVGYLSERQNGDGGFGQMAGRSSNAQSTAYAVQGLVAVSAAPGAVRRGLAYLRGLQRRDGSIAYSRTSNQTPVWVTAQALAALRRRSLPIAPVARGPRTRSIAATVDSEAAPARAMRTRPGRGGAAPASAGSDRAGGVRSTRRRRTVASEAPGSTRAAATLARTGSRDEGEGVPVWLLAIAAGGALVLLVPLRRRLARAR